MNDNCTFPSTGLTITPQGQLTSCCNMKKTGHPSRWSFGHLSEVTNLQDHFYFSDEKADWDENFADGWQKFDQCVDCLGGQKHYKLSQEFKPENGLQYLEFSTSNVCNQSCVMCSSFFSSKWKKMEPLFNRKVSNPYSFTDEDIDKIITVLPTVRKLVLKGGEPFADQKNLRLLKELTRVNPQCELDVITNGQNVSQQFLEALEHHARYPDNVNIAVSIDGLGERYNWIRGGDFDKTIETVQNISRAIKKRCLIIPTVSIYNFFHMKELWDWANDQEYLSIDIYKWPNSVTNYPTWTNVENLLTQEEIDEGIQSQFSMVNRDISLITNMRSNKNEKDISEHKKYTEVMNKIRGFDIYTL